MFVGVAVRRGACMKIECHVGIVVHRAVQIVGERVVWNKMSCWFVEVVCREERVVWK